MCIGDWRAGRLIRSKVSAHSVTNNATFTVLADRTRCGIELAMSANDINNLTAGVITVDGQSFGLSPYGGNMEFNLAYHGDMPTKAFVLSAVGAAAVVITVIEHFATEAMLAAGVDEFQREY